jgi:hypothetical protein
MAKNSSNERGAARRRSLKFQRVSPVVCPAAEAVTIMKMRFKVSVGKTFFKEDSL